MEEVNREALEEQAKQLGIKFNSRIGNERLQTKISEALMAEVEPEVIIDEAPRVNKRVEVPVDPKAAKRRAIIQRGLKRSKVIVYNNDPKERELTTTYSSVRNSFFGDARVIPIGQEWWLQQIHIDNLKSIEIMAMTKDKDGNVRPNGKMTKKFTVDILETDEEAAKAKLAAKAKS